MVLLNFLYFAKLYLGFFFDFTFWLSLGVKAIGKFHESQKMKSTKHNNKYCFTLKLEVYKDRTHIFRLTRLRITTEC